MTTGYALDGDGTRVASTSGGTTTPYLWDTAAPLAELVASGSTAYLHAAGELVATQGSGSTSYPLADALGSIRAITDGAGTITGTAAYDPFGTRTSQTGTQSLLGFTGELTDATGLVDLRARALDPTSGTFTQVDPLRPGAPGVVGYNPYTYAGSNPTTFTDPSGQTGTSELGINWTIVGARTATLLWRVGRTGLTLGGLLTIPLWLLASTLADVDLNRMWDIQTPPGSDKTYPTPSPSTPSEPDPVPTVPAPTPIPPIAPPTGDPDDSTRGLDWPGSPAQAKATRRFLESLFTISVWP